MIENPLLQQRELLAGNARVLLEDLGMVEITGEDRLSWLHAMLSQNIKNLSAPSSTEALLLDPSGHIEVLLHLIVAENSVWLILPKLQIAQLLNWFKKTKFRSKVEWVDQSEKFSVVASWREPISEVFWRDSWPEVTPGGHRYGSKTNEPWQLVENIVAVDQLGEFEATLASLDALRIAAHRAQWNELDEKSLPHELDLLASAVHLSKGCYRGQETVAKVHNLGHPPRRLVLLHLDGSGHLLPEVGDEVVVSESEQVRGKITSVGQHFEMGPIALAVISRSVPEDASLVVNSAAGPIAANQEIIVPQSAGKTVDRSKGPSLGLAGRKLL